MDRIINEKNYEGTKQQMKTTEKIGNDGNSVFSYLDKTNIFYTKIVTENTLIKQLSIQRYKRTNEINPK